MQGPDRLPDGRLRIARIVGVHGVKGAVRLKLFLDDPDSLYGFGPVTDAAGAEYEIDLGHPQKGHWVSRIEGVEDRDRAAALQGTDLYVEEAARPELEEGEFYHADLIGLAAVDADGKALGKVSAVEDFGAGPLIEVLRPSGSPLMLPFTEAVVPEIDFEAGRVVIVPPPGYLDDAKPEGDGL